MFKIAIRVLRAVVAHRRGLACALPLLGEAMGLAALGGCARLLADTQPLAVQMGAGLILLPSAASSTSNAIESDRLTQSTLPDRQASRGGLLTAKEAEVLGLLDRGLSNKLIGRAMGISDETVKWHIKNLFLKLATGTRKHAVGRARLLGLLAH